MFKNPFSFKGRIRRTEYGISFIIYVIVTALLDLLIEESEMNNADAGVMLGIFLYIPILWFFFAQGAKRSHDIGKSGWWQIIPFFAFWLLFERGVTNSNKYGDDPKGLNLGNVSYSPPSATTNTNSTSSGYSGGYTGGHNNYSAPAPASTAKNNTSSEYQSGELYK